MRKLKKSGLAVLLLAVSLGGYSICMENVQAADEAVEFTAEDSEDEMNLTVEEPADENESEAEIADESDENEIAFEEEQENSEFTDDVNGSSAQSTDNVDDVNSIENEKQGFCGADESEVTWKLNEDGTLCIEGKGDMISWESETDVPWAEYKNDITKIEIKEGVTSVASYAFSNCTNVTETVIADSVQEIGLYAFFNCNGLSTVTIG